MNQEYFKSNIFIPTLNQTHDIKNTSNSYHDSPSLFQFIPFHESNDPGIHLYLSIYLTIELC